LEVGIFGQIFANLEIIEVNGMLNGHHNLCSAQWILNVLDLRHYIASTGYLGIFQKWPLFVSTKWPHIAR
jgi:hypothetical protein